MCPEAVAKLRRKGFDVPDKVTREEYHRLADSYTRSWQLKEARAAGLQVADNVPPEELERLSGIIRLQRKGVDVSQTATLAEVESIEQKHDAIRYFHARVVGVSHQNDDGRDRQRIIGRCRVGEVLQISHERENRFDKNAVAVFRANGEQVGYLNADLAQEVAERLERGWQYIPIVKEILDDGVASHSLGLLLLLVMAKPEVRVSEIQEYAKGLVSQIHGNGRLLNNATSQEDRGGNKHTSSVRHFFSKVVGVTHRNTDGSDRQAIIAKCQPFETLDLVHEDENPVDANAIAVRRSNGDQLGYLPAPLAADIAASARNSEGYSYMPTLRRLQVAHRVVQPSEQTY